VRTFSNKRNHFCNYQHQLLFTVIILISINDRYVITIFYIVRLVTAIVIDINKSFFSPGFDIV